MAESAKMKSVVSKGPSRRRQKCIDDCDCYRKILSIDTLAISILVFAIRSASYAHFGRQKPTTLSNALVNRMQKLSPKTIHFSVRRCCKKRTCQPLQKRFSTPQKFVIFSLAVVTGQPRHPRSTVSIEIFFNKRSAKKSINFYVVYLSSIVPCFMCVEEKKCDKEIN